METATADTAPQQPISVDDSIEKAAEVAEAVAESMVREITLSSGVVLRVRPVPPLAIRQASLSVEMPKPPMVYIEDKDREEPNPSDPDYLDELEAQAANQVSVVTDVILLMGTELVSKPDHLSGPEDPEWLEMYEDIGVKIRKETKNQRYLSWLRLIAFQTNRDLNQALIASMSRAGVTEEDIQVAMRQFRRAQERRSD